MISYIYYWIHIDECSRIKNPLQEMKKWKIQIVSIVNIGVIANLQSLGLMKIITWIHVRISAIIITQS